MVLQPILQSVFVVVCYDFPAFVNGK
jgi:hypothetical protein